METTEKIVEAYVRYIKSWFTLPNLKCDGQLEIDLLALEPRKSRGFNKYHIESGVSISGPHSKLTDKPYSSEKLKVRVKAAAQRRTLGYFIERKFGHQNVIKKLKEYGFKEGNYKKIIVTWGWNDDVPEAAKQAGVILWDFRDILNEIAQVHGRDRTYFIDDTMRTLQLMARTMLERE